MQKKVARTPSRGQQVQHRGVTCGSGPSSMVMAISPRAAAAAAAA
jgi:hypothetical protein